MPFATLMTTSGAMMVGTEIVTLDDGLDALGIVKDRPDWKHIVIDVSESDSPFILPRDEELEDMHRLARTVRDLRLPADFKIALVRGPRSRARVADFVDLARSIALDIEVRPFDSTADALAWVGATMLDS